MGKVKKVEPDSPLANSAFYRRKEYDLSWQAIFNTAKTHRRNPSLRAKTESFRDLTNKISETKLGGPKFKPRVSKEEMEEMGCEPIGILTKKTIAKSLNNRVSENRHLSFSYETLANEKTPKRGTPLTHRCVVEMGRNKNKELEELEETVAKIQKSVQKGIMTIEEALIDIEGLKFRRQSTSSAKFYHLEMQLRKKKGDFLEACLACVKGVFAARDRKSRTGLVKEVTQILKLIEAAGDPEGEPDIVSDYGDSGDESSEVVNEATVKLEVSPKSNYTPESVEVTPNVRTGSAAKTRLRFTPLLSSCQRLSNGSTAMKKKRGSFKLTPLRRSSRVAAARLSQGLSSSYMAVNL